MASLGKTVFVIVLLVCLGGCTIHFKASEVELDTEQSRYQDNHSYELEKVAFLVGKDS